jgi:hypothetical protein
MVSAETSLGSDHTPLIFDSGEELPIRSNRFFFETGWFEVEGFEHFLGSIWQRLASQVGGRDITDWWAAMSSGLRQYLRGWSRNIGKIQRDQKQVLLDQIKLLDERADEEGLQEDEWAFRFYLEEQLLNLFRVEEEYWRQRGRVRWALQGDANTAYFHAVANGRRRKCLISRLEMEGGTISSKLDIQEQIYAFYRQLLGTEAARSCGLAANAWEAHARVSNDENLLLELTFSEEELEGVIKAMKTDTAPGPDGFPVAFFQKMLAVGKTRGFAYS